MDSSSARMEQSTRKLHSHSRHNKYLLYDRCIEPGFIFIVKRASTDQELKVVDSPCLFVNFEKEALQVFKTFDRRIGSISLNTICTVVITSLSLGRISYSQGSPPQNLRENQNKPCHPGHLKAL